MSTSDKFWDSKAEGDATSPISDEDTYHRKPSEMQALLLSASGITE